MKSIISPLLCLFLLGCSADGYSPDPNFYETSVFGKWRMVSYADNKQIPFDVTLELKSEKDSLGRNIITGKSPLNFYFSTFTINPSDSAITVYDIQSTKIEGAVSQVSFEKNYYEMLTKVKKYEISESGKTLNLILPSTENQHIVYNLTQ
ncbi:MAG: META domain-containing protein [Spirosomaceae bacterium]|nr:META domain-containing protein [Spirosomataceae bacterium]